MVDCLWLGCVTPGTQVLSHSSAVPTSITPPPPALHDKEAGAAAGCNRLLTRLCWGSRAEGQSHNVFPYHRSWKTFPAAQPGLCPPSSSSIPIPALQTLWFPVLGRDHVPGTKGSVTKAGGSARCRRPLPLQELHLVQHRIPQPRAQRRVPCMATSLFPHVCCSAAVA